MKTSNSNPKALSLAGWIICILCTVFLFFDAITKLFKIAQTVQSSAQIGWPEQYIQSLGLILLICTILYIIPRTSVLGAILLTGYLGGAIAIMVRANNPGHPFLFPLIFGILVWAGLYFRNASLRSLIPIRKKL